MATPAYAWGPSQIPASRRGGGIAVPNIGGSQYAGMGAQASRSKADREIAALNAGAQERTAGLQVNAGMRNNVLNALANLANTSMVADAKTYGDQVALEQIEKQYELDRKSMGLDTNPWMRGLAAAAPAVAGLLWKPKRPDLPAPPGLPGDAPIAPAPATVPRIANDPAFTVEVPGEGFKFDPSISMDSRLWTLPGDATTQFTYDPIEFDVNGFDFNERPSSGLFSQAALWGAG